MVGVVAFEELLQLALVAQQRAVLFHGRQQLRALDLAVLRHVKLRYYLVDQLLIDNSIGLPKVFSLDSGEERTNLLPIHLTCLRLVV